MADAAKYDQMTRVLAETQRKVEGFVASQKKVMTNALNTHESRMAAAKGGTLYHYNNRSYLIPENMAQLQVRESELEKEEKALERGLGECVMVSVF